MSAIAIPKPRPLRRRPGVFLVLGEHGEPTRITEPRRYIPCGHAEFGVSEISHRWARIYGYHDAEQEVGHGLSRHMRRCAPAWHCPWRRWILDMLGQPLPAEPLHLVEV